MIPHRVAMRHGYGICGKLLRTFQQIPQPRRRRRDEIENSMIRTSGAGATRLGKLYLLDTGLLMGGTVTGFQTDGRSKDLGKRLFAATMMTIMIERNKAG